MIRSKRGVRVATSVLAIVLVVGFAVGLTGCSSKNQTASGKMKMDMAKGGPVVLADGTQLCADCAGKGMAPMVKGAVTDENGLQVVKIGLKNGYYSPNMFMVKAGTPVKVVITGKAKKCLAMPTFKALGVKGDLMKTGTATLDLGTLQPGTYDLTCGMGSKGGQIVAQ